MSEIERLRDALSAIGPPPDARELSEILWLACHITPAEAGPEPTPPVPPPTAPTSPEAPRPPTPRESSPAPPGREPLTGLHPRPAPGAEPVGEAAEVLVPTAPMLADALGVQRALRPLKRRVPSRHRRELDEDATATRIADTRLWTPVLVPSPERWLTLSLVVDTGPTMRLWRPLARELAETLIRQGAFQNVHVSYLDETGRITSTPGAPLQDPRTLVDASGRRVVLVLSDCSGPHWWKGHAPRAVRHWAQAGPTAMLQPLAERLWRRTAAPTTPGLAVLPRPGASNTDLRFTPFDGARPPGVPVPVLEVAPRWFSAWARLVTGSGPQPAAVATLAARPSGPAPLHRERELPISERVRRFLATASPDAAELAAHVAVSVPSLPVMRLIQHRILGGSGPGQLAEVLLSGLLRPVGGVRYEFVAGAREALLDTLPRPEALHTRHVLEAVSAEIERRAGTATETFRALLPRDGGPVRLTADTDHFALITPTTRTLLTPAATADPPEAPDLFELLGRPVDDLIGDDWDHPPHPALIGMDGQMPVVLDVLDGHPDLPHGVIRAPRAARRQLARTIVWSLALGHSPNIVNFAFAAFSRRGRSVNDLRDLPHVAADFHDGSPDTPTSALPQILETEWRRREAVLRTAGTGTWKEYRAALADGRATVPLPALVVIMDNTGPWLDAHPDLSDRLVRLYETGAALGVRFIICTPDDPELPGRMLSLVGWSMGPAGHGGDLASLHVLGRRVHPSFLPARVSPEMGTPVIERMRRRGPQAYRLAGGGSRDRYTVAGRAVENVLPQTHDRPLRAAMVGDAEPGGADPERSRAEVGTAIWERLAEEANTSRGDGLGNHHLAFLGQYGPEMEAAARLYGTMLADLGKLPHGDVTATPWKTLVGQTRADEATEAGVLLIPDAGDMTTGIAGPLGITALEKISKRMAGRQNHPVIIMCGEASPVRTLLALLPSAIADRIHVLAPPEWGAPLPELPRHLPRSRLAMTTHGRIPIGIEDGTQTPAVLDFRGQPHLLVTGDPGSGRTNVLRLIFDALSGRDEELYIVDPSGELNDTDFNRPDPPRVSSAIYAATSSQTRSLVDRLIIQLDLAPDDDVHLIIDDHDLLDPRLFLRLEPHIPGGRLHLVIARRGLERGDGADPLLDLWEPRMWADLQMGAPTPGERVPGRGVLTRHHNSRLIQVAAAF